MAFFLIVPSVMIVSVLVVHALANRLGLRIYYTTLAATAVLSFMVDIAASVITPSIGREFLLRLGLIILAVAFLLTLANRFLIQQQRAAEKNFQEEVKAAYEAERDSPLLAKDSPSEDKPYWETEAPPTRYNESIEPDSGEVENQVDSLVVDDSAQIQPVEETVRTEKITEPVESVGTVESAQISEPVAEPKPSEEFPLEKVFEALSEVKPEELEKLNAAEPKPEPEPEFPLEEVFQPLSEVKTEEVEIPKEEPKPEDKLALQEVFQPLSKLKLEKLDKLPAEEVAKEESSEEPETLDDILDKAYNERAKGHVWQAIELYKKALERYRNDEYAPFVAIDLGNIYKEQALYSKAIKIFEEALLLPAVTRNDSIKKEFLNNLEYLRITRDILLKYQAVSVPFSKLNKEILQEIDTEFQKSQRHSEQFK